MSAAFGTMGLMAVSGIGAVTVSRRARSRTAAVAFVTSLFERDC